MTKMITNVKLRNFFILVILLLCFSTNKSYSQSSSHAIVVNNDIVTEEELRKYARIIDAIHQMKAKLQLDYNKLIKNEELMGGGRFNEIKQANGDTIKLGKINVTDAELEAYKEIQAKYEKMKLEFKKDYTSLIKNELGASQYNKITKALKGNTDLKKKYENILAQVQSDDIRAERVN